MLDINIQVPYTTRPHMTRNTGALFNRNPNPVYIQEKTRELNLLGAALWGHTYEAKTNQLVERAAEFLGKPKVHSIVDLALNFEEDLAIMHNGILSAICFCFPSSWVPADRVGLTLSEIHRPVADNHNLVLASDKLAKTMADPVLGSFKRQVWTITTNSKLSNYPHHLPTVEPRGVMDLYFRLETQTTAPLGDGYTSLFFVKIDVVPLSSIWESHGSQIKASVNSMSEAVLEYKNLKKIKPILNYIQLH